MNIKSRREQADYSNKIFLSREDTQLILKDARQIVDMIKEFLSLKQIK